MKIDALSKKKQIIILAFILLICIFFVLFPCSLYYLKSLLTGSTIDFNHTFLISSDYSSQAIPYYREFYRLLDSGNVSYSWNLFLGGPYYISKTLFTVGDPFSLLGYVPYKLGMPVSSILFFATGLKLMLSGLFFSRFLECHKIRFSVRIPFCVAFMLSGWATIFIEQPYFLSWYCFIPIILTGVEEYLQSNKKGWFFFGSLLLLVTNYYLTWSFCIFILVYWFVRWYSLNNKWGKHFIISSLKILGVFICALLCTGFLFIPSFLLLINNPRLSTVQLATYSSWSSTNLLSLLINFFIPVVKYDSLLYHDPNYYFFQIGIYCGIFPLLLIPQYFKQASKREKYGYAALLLFCVLSIASPIVGKLIFRTYSLRYTYWFVPTLLLIGSLSLNNCSSFKNRTLVVSEIVLFLIVLSLGIVYPLSSGLNIQNYPESKMLIITLLLSLVYTFVLIKYSTKTKKLIYVLIAFCCLESTINAYHVIDSQTNTPEQAEYLKSESQIDSVYQALRAYDPSLYRVNLDISEVTSDNRFENIGMFYGIPTIETYDSTYNYYLHDFLDWMKLYPNVNWIITFDDPTSYQILNAKYSIVNANIDQTFYQYIGTALYLPNADENYLIYLHNGDFHFARSYSSFVADTSVTELSNDPEHFVYETIDLLNTSLAVSENQVTTLNEKYSNTTTHYIDAYDFTNHSVFIKASIPEDSYYFLSIPYSEGWTITIDNQITSYEKVQGGFIGLAIPKGSHEIELSFTTPGLKIGLIVSILGILLSLITLAVPSFISVNKKHKQDKVNNNI